MAKKHFGKCALCRQESKLTFEHIPPASAFNSTPSKPVIGDKILFDEDRLPWDTSGLHFDNQQSGMGKFSLCKTCNNNTGSWYVNDYSLFAHIIHCAFQDPAMKNMGGIGIKDIHPLRFIKQVVSMFCSINNCDDERLDSLRDFVLNKTQKGIDKSKYKICMYFTKSMLTKYVPITAILKMNEKGRCESIALTEITAYPFGFILYFSPTETWKYDGFDITEFADIDYDKLATIEMPLTIYEVNDIFPTYFRTKEEIMKCRITNPLVEDDDPDEN